MMNKHALQGTRTMTLKKISLISIPMILVSGCMNMPTPEGQITGSYVSPLMYEKYECDQLSVETSSLARRENQLASAQEQRVKTSKTQAFVYGYGQGDGIEASELANVRGEKEAVRTAMESKGC
jgi:hypothetical protein